MNAMITMVGVTRCALIGMEDVTVTVEKTLTFPMMVKPAHVCTCMYLHVSTCTNFFSFAVAATVPCGPNNCDQLCYVDTDGTFVCDCNTGYEIGRDGQTCNGEIVHMTCTFV